MPSAAALCITAWLTGDWVQPAHMADARESLTAELERMGARTEVLLRVHAARTCSLVCAACCMLHRTLHSFTAQAHRAKVAIEREERERLRSSDAAAWERSLRPTGPVPHRRSTDEAEQPAALAAAAAKRPRLMPPADGSAYARRIPILTVPSSWRG